MSFFEDYCQALNERNSILLIPPTPNLTQILKVLSGIFSENKKIAASCYFKTYREERRPGVPAMEDRARK